MADQHVIKTVDGTDIYLNDDGKFCFKVDRDEPHRWRGKIEKRFATLKQAETALVKRNDPTSAVDAMTISTSYWGESSTRRFAVYGSRSGGRYTNRDFLDKDGHKIDGQLFLYDQSIVDDLAGIDQRRKRLDDERKAITNRAIVLTVAHMIKTPIAAEGGSDDGSGQSTAGLSEG